MNDNNSVEKLRIPLSWIDEILNSSRYRSMHIPPETVLDLLRQIPPSVQDQKVKRKIIREKLHHIVAPYLGDLDYPHYEKKLHGVMEKKDPDEIKTLCREILLEHASTKERLADLECFYQKIFSVTGLPSSILDLACGLNPFSFPWMGLPATVEYHAYDIHLPRIELINQFFKGMGLQPLSCHQDILTHPPKLSADVAFIFKEAHRMEQRQKGCSRSFWQQLDVRWIIVTLPRMSLTGKHDLSEKHRLLVGKILDSLPWKVQEQTIGNEMVFCIRIS